MFWAILGHATASQASSSKGPSAAIKLTLGPGCVQPAQVYDTATLWYKSIHR